MTPTPIAIVGGAVSVPRTFVLQGTGDLTLESVTATIDGSAAGSDFDAVLSLYDQAGNLLSRTKPNSQITAGQSAIVTWAPFLRRAAASSGSVGITNTFQRTQSTGETIPNTNTATALTFDTSLFSTGTAPTTADNKTFTLAAGIWLLSGLVSWETTVAAPDGEAYFTLTRGSSLTFRGVDYITIGPAASTGVYTYTSKITQLWDTAVDGTTFRWMLRKRIGNSLTTLPSDSQVMMSGAMLRST